jgi:hypothetical protein
LACVVFSDTDQTTFASKKSFVRKPALPPEGDAMSDNYIIEIEPQTSAGSIPETVQAGLVIRECTGFRFFAATRAFFDLEQQVFKSPQAAAAAALRHFSLHHA